MLNCTVLTRSKGSTTGTTRAESRSARNRGIDGAFSDPSLQRAEDYVLDGKIQSSSLFLHKGYFPNTFIGLENHGWRFVHLGPDLYLPTLEGLKCFYPKLVPGGVMLLHDYYSFFDGVRRAADEYFASMGVEVVPFADKAGTGIVIKPKSDRATKRHWSVVPPRKSKRANTPEQLLNSDMI